MSEMAGAEVRELAAVLAEATHSPGDDVFVRRGVVTAVNRTNNTYTLTLGGGSIPNVPAYRDVWALVGDRVDVLFDGNSVCVVGIVGASVWQTPTFQNSWASHSASYVANYMRDATGIVHFKGLLVSGTINVAAFTLPSEYRPSTERIISTVSNNGSALVLSTLRVLPIGEVRPCDGSSAGWFSIDGLSYHL